MIGLSLVSKGFHYKDDIEDLFGVLGLFLRYHN